MIKPILLAALLAVPAAASQPGAPAPELSLAAAWLNGGRAPSREELEGRITVLYFWSFGSATSLLELGELRRTAAGEPASTLFIGAHAGRTTREKDPRAVREAVIGLDVDDRTADDSDGRLAAAFKVRVLPTIFLLGPDGRVAARWEGETKSDQLRVELARVRTELARDGKLSRERLPDPKLERDAAPPAGPLSWPTGLSSRGNHLFVAETGRNRVLELDARGKVLSVHGTGARGYNDGPEKEAMFDRPIALDAGDGDVLVGEMPGIVRRIDHRGLVTTLDFNFLRLPTGLARHGARVFAAAAAGERIFWRPERSLGFSPYAGTGEAGRADGALPAASFSAPWALAVSSNSLYIADSRTAALRQIDLTGSSVATLHTGAPLARPVALAVLGEELWAADAETGALARLRPAPAKQVCAGLEGPAGLAVLDGAFVVSEPGRGRLVRVDPATCKISEFAVTGLPKSPAGPPEAAVPPEPEKLSPTTREVRAGKVKVVLKAALPEGYVLNPRSRLRWRVTEAAGPLKLGPVRKGFVYPARLPVALTVELSEGRGELAIETDFHYCRADLKGVSRSRSARVVLVLDASKSAKARTAEVVVPF